MVHCAISWGGSIGKPVAEIVPPSPDAGQKSWIGSMKDTMDIIGDIVSPVIDEKRYRGAARLKLLLDTHVCFSRRSDPCRHCSSHGPYVGHGGRQSASLGNHPDDEEPNLRRNLP